MAIGVLDGSFWKKKWWRHKFQIYPNSTWVYIITFLSNILLGTQNKSLSPPHCVLPFTRKQKRKKKEKRKEKSNKAKTYHNSIITSSFLHLSNFFFFVISISFSFPSRGKKSITKADWEEGWKELEGFSIGKSKCNLEASNNFPLLFLLIVIFI